MCPTCLAVLASGEDAPQPVEYKPSLRLLFDECKGVCHLCDRPVKWDGQGHAAPSRDHIVPRVKGGVGWENLALAHRGCNNRRGHMPVEEYRALLRERRRERRRLAAEAARARRVGAEVRIVGELVL